MMERLEKGTPEEKTRTPFVLGARQPLPAAVPSWPGLYYTPEDFLADIAVIKDNCLLFNPPNSTCLTLWKRRRVHRVCRPLTLDYTISLWQTLATRRSGGAR